MDRNTPWKKVLTATWNMLRSGIGHQLLIWALQVFPEPERLIVAQALANCGSRLEKVKYDE